MSIYGQVLMAIKINLHSVGANFHVPVFDPFIPTKWYKKGDTVVSFSFPDPQLMNDFLQLSIDCLQDRTNCHHDPKLKRWLKEHKAKLATNEYMDGIEITID